MPLRRIHHRDATPCLLALALAGTLAVAWQAVCGAQSIAPVAAAGFRVELAGTLRFPDEAPAADGTLVPVTGLSGVAWLGDDRWAAVMDNSDRLVTFELELAADAAPVAVRDVRCTRLSARHDYEDLAVLLPGAAAVQAGPPQATGRDARLTWLLVCEEDTPAIHRVALDDGRLAATIAIPPLFAGRRSNRGLESLCVDPDGGCIWTANEEALTADGPAVSATAGTVVRLTRLPLPGDAAGAALAAQFAYAVDPPHAGVSFLPGRPLSGVVALVAVGGGRLLVLERSAVRGLPPFENRIYLVDTSAAQDVSSVGRDLAAHSEACVAKRLLWKGGLGCNIEGLAIGPARPGCTTLVAISDNGGLSAPAQLVGFRLFRPLTSP